MHGIDIIGSDLADNTDTDILVHPYSETFSFFFALLTSAPQTPYTGGNCFEGYHTPLGHRHNPTTITQDLSEGGLRAAKRSAAVWEGFVCCGELSSNEDPSSRVPDLIRSSPGLLSFRGLPKRSAKRLDLEKAHRLPRELEGDGGTDARL